MFNHADTQAKTSSPPSLFTVLPGLFRPLPPRERGSVPDPPPALPADSISGRIWQAEVLNGGQTTR
jgi:hypothetical protein